MLSRRLSCSICRTAWKTERICSYKGILPLSARAFASDRSPKGQGYSGYGHGREKPGHWMQIVWPSIVLVGLGASLVDFPWIWSCLKSVFKAEAATVVAADTTPDMTAVSSDKEDEKPKSKQKRVGFRDKKVIEYENRIRMFSSPEKIFRYFATLKAVDNDSDASISASHIAGIYMTPEDFVRAITPGIKQPEGLGLDKFKTFDRKKLNTIKADLVEDTIFNKIGAHGLLNFSDFIFLLTVLSTSPRHFAIAFQMFDLNGDGELDFAEFQQVQEIIRRQTSINSKYRDREGNNGSPTHPKSQHHQSTEDSGLANYFFGVDRKKKLAYQDFLDFQEQLQRDILFIEFQRRQPNEELKIPEFAFAEMLLMHSGLSDVKVTKMLKRVKKLCKENPELCPGCTFNEIDMFFVFINNITDVDTALTFYQMAGASIDPGVIQHVAKTVAFVDIPDNLIRVIFAMFDENQDGELSSKEFVNVMKRRLMRGLEKSKDTGIVKLLDAAWKCAQEKTPAHHN